MAQPVKRSYNSERRKAQAAATRGAILGAAHRLFVEHGYVATTVETIAAEVGVSAKTVYDGFVTKAGVLRAVWDLALKGDTDDAPVAERSWYQETLSEADPRRIVRRVARQSVAVKQRIGPLIRAIRDAAAVDPDGAALWALIQSDFHSNQRVIVQAIADRKGLRRGVGVDRAADVLWTLNHPEVWLLLTDERGWSAAEFEEWFAESAAALLLRA